MRSRTLGRNGPRVSAVGLGCMGMSDFYGGRDRAESLATLHRALDCGITMLDRRWLPLTCFARARDQRLRPLIPQTPVQHLRR